MIQMMFVTMRKKVIYTEIIRSLVKLCLDNSEDDNDDEFHTRGCVKRPASFTGEKAWCQKSEDSNGFKEIERCYCYQNECNHANGLNQSNIAFGALFLFVVTLFQ